jgi:hypothetical protein
VEHNHGRGYSSSTKVTFMFTRYWTTLPFSTTTFCSWIQAPVTFFRVLLAQLYSKVQSIFEALGRGCCDFGNSCDGHGPLLSALDAFRSSLLTALLAPDLNCFRHPFPKLLDARFMTRVGRYEFGWNPA